MENQQSLEKELTELIIKTARLEDLEPDGIQPEENLFGDGLGLDSIDALEIAIAVSQQYGVELHADNQEQLMRIFATVRSLAAYIGANNGK